jgi:hypothetical protein
MADQGKPANELQDEDVDVRVPEEERVFFDPEGSPRVGEVRDPSVDRAIIAKTLIWMMAAGLVLHYAAVVVLEVFGKHDSVKSLETIFNAWLPILSGLVGAAVTYYFTREK